MKRKMFIHLLSSNVKEYCPVLQQKSQLNLEFNLGKRLKAFILIQTEVAISMKMMTSGDQFYKFDDLGTF
jgi:hypothetical protein